MFGVTNMVFVESMPILSLSLSIHWIILITILILIESKIYCSYKRKIDTYRPPIFICSKFYIDFLKSQIDLLYFNKSKRSFNHSVIQSTGMKKANFPIITHDEIANGNAMNFHNNIYSKLLCMNDENFLSIATGT